MRPGLMLIYCLFGSCFAELRDSVWYFKDCEDGEGSEDRVFVSLNPLGPAVSAHRSRPRLALLPFKRATGSRWRR